MNRHRTSIIAGTLALAAALVAASGGCSTRFPYGTSWDRHNFISEAHRPISLELVDTVTDEVVWTLDIPVQHMAIVDLEHRQDWQPTFSGAAPAYKIAWQVFDDTGTLISKLEHEQMLSGNPHLLKMKIREGPEPIGDPNLITPQDEQHKRKSA